MAIAQLEVGRYQKKKIFSLSLYFASFTPVNQPIACICFFCLLFFYSLSSSFHPVHSSIHFSLSSVLHLSLLPYLPVSVARSHRADMLTCASSIWASLLIRLRSVLREIPSTYTPSQKHTGARRHANTSHAQAHTNWQTAKPPRSGLSELFSLRWWVYENVCLRSYVCVSVGIWNGVFLLRSSSLSLSLISLPICYLPSKAHYSEIAWREQEWSGQCCHPTTDERGGGGGVLDYS